MRNNINLNNVTTNRQRWMVEDIFFSRASASLQSSITRGKQVNAQLNWYNTAFALNVVFAQFLQKLNRDIIAVRGPRYMNLS